MDALYDTIGPNYANLRRPDSSIQMAIDDALAHAESIVNVGAGAGSYEPKNKSVVAVEISNTMLRQRPAGGAPTVQADAMALPFQADAFDASMAILTVHQWPDRRRGLTELRRVTRGPVVILTRDPTYPGFWLTDYIPEVLDADRSIFPDIGEYADVLGSTEVKKVPIPYNCTDGFMCAYWRRPEAYLDERVRSAISTFSKLPDIRSGLEQLKHDLQSGSWQSRYGDLLDQNQLDMGYRLVVGT